MKKFRALVLGILLITLQSAGQSLGNFAYAETLTDNKKLEELLPLYYSKNPFNIRRYNGCTIVANEDNKLVENVIKSEVVGALTAISESVTGLINLIKDKMIKDVEASASNFICTQAKSFSSDILEKLGISQKGVDKKIETQKSVDTSKIDSQSTDAAELEKQATDMAKDSDSEVTAQVGEPVVDLAVFAEKAVAVVQRILVIVGNASKTINILRAKGISGHTSQADNKLEQSKFALNAPKIDLNFNQVKEEINGFLSNSSAQFESLINEEISKNINKTTGDVKEKLNPKGMFSKLTSLINKRKKPQGTEASKGDSAANASGEQIDDKSLLSTEDFMRYYVYSSGLYDNADQVSSPEMLKSLKTKRAKIFQNIAVSAWTLATSSLADINNNLTRKIENVHQAMDDLSGNKDNNETRALQDVIKLNTQVIISVAEQFFPLIIMKAYQVDLMSMRYIRQDNVVYANDIWENIEIVGI